MRIATFGATGAVGSSLVVHLLKGAGLRAGDALVMVGRASSASFAKLQAMRTDLVYAFEAGIVSLKVCPSIEALQPVHPFAMAAGASVDQKTTKRPDFTGKNFSLFHDTARGCATQSERLCAHYQQSGGNW